MQYFDKVVYTFSADNEPTGTIDSGEIVIFRTQDCFSNQMHSESQLVTSCDYSKMNPATGPLFVRDAQPGDVIKVELLDVQCDTIGTTTTLPKIGPLWDKCETRTKRIPIENGKAVFNDVTFPINPMIGVIGVAPEKGKSVPCGYPGSHGGNLDCKLMVKGNTAYFPVRVEGGLVQMGDMHAVMGDSELCGTGLEINGTVIARVSVIKNCPLEWPVLETADTWYTMASAAGYEEALRHASVQMQGLVAAATGWDATDAYLYMSLRGDLEVCQACKHCEVDLIVRLGVPKADMKRPLVGYRRPSDATILKKAVRNLTDSLFLCICACERRTTLFFPVVPGKPLQQTVIIGIVIKVQGPLVLHAGLQDHEAQFLHLAHALLLVLAMFQHVGQIADLLAFGKLRRHAAGVVQHLVGHAQFRGDMAVVFQLQRPAPAGEIIEIPLGHGLLDTALGNGLDDGPGTDLRHVFPPYREHRPRAFSTP